MTQTAALLQLSQWLSPAFPISAYAYSHGLEAEVTSGRVANGAAVESWIGCVLRSGAGRSDAILLSEAMADGSDLDELANLARALSGSAERWEETRDQGAALARTLHEIGIGDGVARPFPVVLGAASRGLALPAPIVAALFLQAFAGNLVSAAVRFVPLGQAEGQGILSRLRPICEQVATEAASARA